MKSKVFKILSKAMGLAGISMLAWGGSLQAKVVATTGEWAPYTGESIPNQGFVTQIVKEAFKAAGEDVEFKFEKWKKAQKLIEKKPKKFNGTFPWFKNPDREKNFYFSNPIVETVNVFVARKGESLSHVKALSDLSGKKVSATLSYSYGEDFDKAAKDKKLSITKVKSDAEGLKQLMAGDVDFFTVEKFVGQSLAAESGNQSKVKYISTDVFKKSPVHFMVSKSHPGGQALVAKFNEGLAKLKASGRYDAILADAFK